MTRVLRRLRVLREAALVFCLCGGATSFLHAQACHGQVRINEILADPARDWNGDAVSHFRDDEWVEIVNAGSAAVALDSLRLSDASNVFRFGFSGPLGPGQRVVVYGNQSVAWETTQGLPIAGLSLNNAGDTVRLWRLAGSDTLLVDEYIYAAHEGLDDRSTARVPDGGDTWYVFDALNPYTGTTPPLGTNCPPTPGAGNACPTAVEPLPWGAVKRLYHTR